MIREHEIKTKLISIIYAKINKETKLGTPF